MRKKRYDIAKGLVSEARRPEGFEWCLVLTRIEHPDRPPLLVTADCEYGDGEMLRMAQNTADEIRSRPELLEEGEVVTCTLWRVVTMERIDSIDSAGAGRTQ